MKLLTKTIANKIKSILSDIIDEEHNAFAKGRLITDNALVAMECFYWLKKKDKGKKGVMALKLDMSKAYDRLELEFVTNTLATMGFPLLGGSHRELENIEVDKLTFSLIDHDLRCWDRKALSDTLNPQDVIKVSSIPLSSRCLEDRRIWNYEDDEDLSVWSAYHHLGDERRKNLDGPSGVHLGLFWKRLWKVPISAKVLEKSVEIWTVLLQNRTSLSTVIPPLTTQKKKMSRNLDFLFLDKFLLNLTT
ncbi:unnamed protein product [Vicia faba]|uniref:Reverse transcriptase n=1 Tax=Vicia faba TaxID=3906 RepID=A0AAV0ZVU6_VICFA|nr:unnamed protein product [Vicia faba]